MESCVSCMTAADRFAAYSVFSMPLEISFQ